MAKKFKRRDLILEKASQIFTDKGFAATSLEDIADVVGIKRESLYYYYPGKYDLLYDIIEPQITTVMEKFQQIVATKKDIKSAVREGINNHLRQFNANYLHMAMAIRKNSKGDVQLKFIQLRDMFKAYETIWLELMTEGCRNGEIKSDMPPKMLVYSLLGLCNSLSSWYRPDGAMSLDQIGRYYADIILDGVAR